MTINTNWNEVEVSWRYDYDLASLIDGKQLSDTRETISDLRVKLANDIDSVGAAISTLLEAIASTPDKYWKITS